MYFIFRVVFNLNTKTGMVLRDNINCLYFSTLLRGGGGRGSLVQDAT